ncbi:MAG TPA: hypothetical protein VED59_02440 [Acidimicrobiales bacterium]|nr:hypothetical protein [Acidimicrobiales bacterium]
MNYFRPKYPEPPRAFSWRAGRSGMLLAGLVTVSISLATLAGAASASKLFPDSTWASAPTSHRHQPASLHKLGPLSGKWSGSYSGSFSGTFSLTWQESGQNLSGTIMISGFGNAPTSIHGTVKGTSISFGTVGSESITYSGSASGNSMSGSWQIQAGGRSMGGGSWKASKSH